MRKVHLFFLILFVAIFSACGGSTDTESTEPAASASNAVMDAAEETMTEADSTSDDSTSDDDMTAEEMEPTDEPADDEPMAAEEAMDEPMDEPDESMTATELPDWQTLTLIDARTGESFTLADYSGKTVFVEPMATWCTNCRQQMFNVQAARPSLNGEEVVFIGLSVETNISNDDLARYADGNGFDWRFAVMSPEMLQALADTFGRTITNPPSTPHFIINPDGTHSVLITGIESPDEIIAAVGG